MRMFTAFEVLAVVVLIFVVALFGEFDRKK